MITTKIKRNVYIAKTHLQWPPNQERSVHSFSTPTNLIHRTSENGQTSEGIVALYTPKTGVDFSN